MSGGIPAGQQQWIGAEKAIHVAIGTVSLCGTDERLTEAMRLLAEARDKVIDFINSQGGVS